MPTSKRSVLMFPGQGSQAPGMGGELFERFPALVEAANAQLGYSIEDVCRNDQDGRLGDTRYTQVALYVVNALSYYAWVRDEKRFPDALGGHSLGEYNALLAAEVFDFLTGLRLVQKRGELMSEANGGAMLAVVGLDEPSVRRALTAEGLGEVDVANINGPQQVVLAGSPGDIDQAKAPLKAAGAKVLVPLKVSGAFHSRQMQPAAAVFGAALADVELRPPRIPVVSNYTGAYYGDTVLKNLSQQIASPVRWTDCVAALASAKPDEYLEIGPGKVLTGLLKRMQMH